MITLQMMPPMMFGGLVVAMLIGFPVAFTLAAVGLSFGFLAIHLGFFDLNFLQAIPGRMFGWVIAAASISGLWRLVKRSGQYHMALYANFSLFWTAAPLLLAGTCFGLSQQSIALFALAGAGGIVIAPMAGWIADRGLTRQGTGGAMLAMLCAFVLAFAGGAAGKLVCAFIGARIGAVATVWLTETVTALGIVALLPLSLEGALVLLPLVGVALNGTSSVLYGSVPDLVTPARRQRAFGIFYTGTIGAGAISPAIYGVLGDAVGVPSALVVVSAGVLLTLPITLALRPALATVRES